jgi:hypothetical protein
MLAHHPRLIAALLVGVASDVGNVGINGARHSLAFDVHDVLYMLTPVIYADSDPVLYTIDAATAMPTGLGPVPGLAIYFAHHGAFHPDSNLMHALDATGDHADIVNLVAIDTASRSVVSLVPLPGDDIHTLAFVTLSAVPAPVMVAAASRMIHGSAGPLNLPLPATPASLATEPRAGTAGGGSTRVGFLEGDVNASRAVTLSDRLTVNSVLAQDVTAATFLRDVDASGTLTLADLLTVNTRLAQSLPAP